MTMASTNGRTVSVIMPAYNEEGGIREAVDAVQRHSALRQQLESLGVTNHERAGAAAFRDPHTVRTTSGNVLKLLDNSGDQGCAAARQLYWCATEEEPVKAEQRRVADIVTHFLIQTVRVDAILVQKYQ